MAAEDTGRTAFELAFDGTLDEVLLGRLQKLLDLRPVGRLSDGEDEGFGRRRQHHGDGRSTELALYRRSDARWWFRLRQVGPPEDERVERSRREVAAAAGHVGLTPAWPLSGARADDESSPDLQLPSLVALSVDLGDGEDETSFFPSRAFDVVRSALELRSEWPREGGQESGWRYLRRDDDGAVLLQLFSEEWRVRRVQVLHDGGPPDPETVEGVRLQILAAARLAGLAVEHVEPPPPRGVWHHQELQEVAWGPPLLVVPDVGPVDLDPHQLLALGDRDTQSLAVLLDRFDAREAPYELRRGLVLSAVAGLVPDARDRASHGLRGLLPADGVIDDRLRDEIADLLRVP